MTRGFNYSSAKDFHIELNVLRVKWVTKGNPRPKRLNHIEWSPSILKRDGSIYKESMLLDWILQEQLQLRKLPQGVTAVIIEVTEYH